MPKRLKYVLIVVGLFFFSFVIADSMGVFSKLPYTEVPHGNHTHYVPHDRDANVPIDRFPTQRPATDERIMPDGRVVKADVTGSE
jgi:hypothetical protein